MQAWIEAEKSMSKPSCFLIRNQESNQTGKLEYFVISGLANDKDLPGKLDVCRKDSW